MKISAYLTFEGLIVSDYDEDAPLATVRLSNEANDLTDEQKLNIAIAVRDAIVQELSK